MNTVWSLYYEDPKYSLAGTIKVRPFLDLMGDGMYHAEPILQSLYKMIKYPVQSIPDSIKDGVTSSVAWYQFADLLIDSFMCNRSVTINTVKASLLVGLYSDIVNTTLKENPSYYGVTVSDNTHIKIKDVHMKGSYRVSFIDGPTKIGVGKYIKFNNSNMDTSYFSKKTENTGSYRGFDIEGLDRQILDLIYLVFFYELTGFTSIKDSRGYTHNNLGIVYLPQVLGKYSISTEYDYNAESVLVDSTYFDVPEDLGTGISLTSNKGCIRKSILNEFRDTLFHGTLRPKCTTDRGSSYVFDPYDEGKSPVRLNKFLSSLELLLNSDIKFKTLVLEYPGTNLKVFQQNQLAHILSRLNSELGIHIWMVTPNMSSIRGYFITLLSAMHYDEDYSKPAKSVNLEDYWKISTNDEEVCYITGTLKKANTAFHNVSYCKDYSLFRNTGTYQLSPYSVVLSDDTWLYKH